MAPAPMVGKTSVENEDVMPPLITNPPRKLTEEQRVAIRQLLQEYKAIFSKGEFDIGRTHLVQYRIEIKSAIIDRFGSHFVVIHLNTLNE